MRFLIIGLNYGPDGIGIAPYTQGLAEDLAAIGHHVHVIAGNPYYPEWRVRDGFGGGWRRTFENGVTVERCPIYVPSNPTGIRRILHLISFSLSALFPAIRASRRSRPDVVLTIAPSLLSAPVALLGAREAAACSWLHIQDFELEAAFAVGLLGAQSVPARLARWFERKMFRGFDQLSSISPEMCRKLETHRADTSTIHEIRNWAEIDAVRPLEGASSYREAWGIEAPHVALYSGNIGNKQGIEIVIEAARHLSGRPDLCFVICGQGPNRAEVEASARDLPNVIFRDLQPREQLGDLLGLATVHLLPQKADAADLVLPSKLTNMLASGRPVVATAAPQSGLAREVAGCGIVTRPEDAAEFGDAISRLIDTPEIYAPLARAARIRAETVWNRKAIVAGFAQRAADAVARKRTLT